MAFEQRGLKISPAVHERVTAVKRQMEAELARPVTYSEVIEYLFTRWEQAARLIHEEAKL